MEPPKETKASENLTVSQNEDGKEVYTSSKSATGAAPAPTPAALAPVVVAPAPVIEEEDDLSAPVAEGTACKRTSCGHSFVSDEVSRGTGPEAECRYHPLPVRLSYFLCC